MGQPPRGPFPAGQKVSPQAIFDRNERAAIEEQLRKELLPDVYQEADPMPRGKCSPRKLP